MKMLCLLLPAMLLLGGSATAGEDHERARHAMETGQILPLRDILSRAEAAYPGQMVEAELDSDDDPPIYKLKMLTSDGRVLKLLYDARNGDLLRSRIHGGHR